MIYIILWLILSFLVGIAGTNRTIGFFGAFVLSIILSPVVGVIGVALSRREEDKPKHSVYSEPPSDEVLEKARKYDEMMGNRTK